MKTIKWTSILLSGIAALYTISSANNLCSAAHSASARAQLSNEQIYNILMNEGFDRDLVSAAMSQTRTANNVHDFIAAYYPKQAAINRSLQISSRTSYDSFIVEPFCHVGKNGSSCVIDYYNGQSASDEQFCIMGSTRYIEYECTVTPTSVSAPMFDVLFWRTAPNVTPDFSCLSSSTCKKQSASGQYVSVNWSSYITCKIIGVGDVDCNGSIDVADALAAINIKNNEWTFSDEITERRAADVDGDGDVDQNDVNDILDYLANLRDTFFPEFTI